MAIDRRVHRTRQALYDAVVRLMLERPYEEIAVPDIAAEARVGRSTFYAQFRSKDDLVARSLERLRPVLQVGREAQLRNPRIESCQGTLGLLRHMKEYRPLLTAIEGMAGHAIVLDAIRCELARFLGAYARQGAHRGMPRKLVLDFITGTFMSVAMWWLSEQSETSPEEVDAIFHRLVGSGIPAGFFFDDPRKFAA
ncbi:TetR/AcrR family transcriptional regulator [Mesorhizobium sp. J428]|uniref:TetR/AcrR family transcriptional regulator n=1 Tax=Mesorhizobium sp. J428 TaxID=2898440 RepID=UPI00215116E3|nr:TetR/AcrR family transcriptional regulator [Mesorhizobium sp. J428]MCR5859908.1 TetR/AcrR family transcriptional regulator [Mesorhizobium sp. J428]